MSINITNADLKLCKQTDKQQKVRLFLLDDNLVTIDEIQGYCIGGDLSIDANSDIRRTLNITLYSVDSSYIVDEYNRIWFNKRIKAQLGLGADSITWYNLGYFVFNTCSYTYSTSDKTITIQCSDMITLLDGTHDGILDGQSFLIEAGNDMKKVVEDLLDNHTNIKDYYIATIGEYGCLQGKSISWKQNRMDTGSSLEVVTLQEKDSTDYLSSSPYTEDDTDPNYVDMGSWHTVPYDLEFSAGTSMHDILVKIRDLYPGYELFFDTDGQLILDLIPTCEHEPILLDYFDLEPLVIDENLNIDFTTVKNATRIYGKSIEVDRYADNESVELKPYIVDNILKGYKIEINLEKFILASNLKVGFQMPEVDESYDTTLPLYLFVNHYESTTSDSGKVTETYTPYTILCTTRENIINTDKDSMESETVYKPMKLSDFISGESYSFKYISNQDTFMYLGMYQVESYIEDTNDESPFAIQKIGKRLQVLSGGEYDDITDVILCKERAEYENWLAGRFNDTITITTLMIPFLDVNQKVRYRSFSTGEIEQYIIKNVNMSFTENTCNITMSKFYDLYPFIICSSGIGEYRTINSVVQPNNQIEGAIWEQIINEVLMSTSRVGDTVTSSEMPENQKEGDIWEEIITV